LLILREAPGDATQETILRLIREYPTITQKEMASRIGLTPDGVSPIEVQRIQGYRNYQGCRFSWEKMKPFTEYMKEGMAS